MQNLHIEQRGEEYSLVRYIHQRIRNNKNFLATITGPTGSGKSWSALSMAELIDPDFNVDRVIFKARELMALINKGELKPGSVIIWDEAGIDLSNRNWQSVTNKMLNSLLQTFRHRNFILFFTVPYSDFVDASSRKLFHANFETTTLDKESKEVHIKPKLIQYNPNMGKFYRKYLKVYANGKLVKIRKWKVPKPSDNLIKAYEQKKSEFTRNLNLGIQKELEKLEPQVAEESSGVVGVPITCNRCSYTWGYKGKHYVIQCPKCGVKMKNPYIEIPKLLLNAPPTT